MDILLTPLQLLVFNYVHRELLTHIHKQLLLECSGIKNLIDAPSWNFTFPDDKSYVYSCCNVCSRWSLISLGIDVHDVNADGRRFQCEQDKLVDNTYLSCKTMCILCYGSFG